MSSFEGASGTFKEFNLGFIAYLGGIVLICAVGLTYWIARVTWRQRYPYSLICKCGAKAPASYIFISGFNSAGLLYLAGIVLVGNRLRAEFNAFGNSVADLSIVSMVADLFGIVSIIAMMLMSLVSVYEYETLHNRLVVCFTGTGIIYQWFMFGLALNTWQWNYYDYARITCAIVQTLSCMVMYACNYIENTLNGITAFRNKEAISPRNADQYQTFTDKTQPVYYPEVHLSMKIWVILQYSNIFFCAWFFSTLTQFLSNYNVRLVIAS